MNLLGSGFANAHDTWANGKKVPDWVKASCCGPEDVHHLHSNQVHGPYSREDLWKYYPKFTNFGDPNREYYMVDGYNNPIPDTTALPSQDGDYWIFYREAGDEISANGQKTGHHGQSGVYCFFVPMNE